MVKRLIKWEAKNILGGFKPMMNGYPSLQLESEKEINMLNSKVWVKENSPKTNKQSMTVLMKFITLMANKYMLYVDIRIIVSLWKI